MFFKINGENKKKSLSNKREIKKNIFIIYLHGYIRLQYHMHALLLFNIIFEFLILRFYAIVLITK